jgi:hypothetical protein
MTHEDFHAHAQKASLATTILGAAHGALFITVWLMLLDHTEPAGSVTKSATVDTWIIACQAGIGFILSSLAACIPSGSILRAVIFALLFFSSLFLLGVAGWGLGVLATHLAITQPMP